MEGFAVTCPLAPDVPHLRSGSCSSPRALGLDFLQTPPHDDALVLLLAFGSANTWHGDFHPASSVPCPAHTSFSPAPTSDLTSDSQHARPSTSHLRCTLNNAVVGVRYKKWLGHCCRLNLLHFKLSHTCGLSKRTKLYIMPTF